MDSKSYLFTYAFTFSKSVQLKNEQIFKILFIVANIYFWYAFEEDIQLYSIIYSFILFIEIYIIHYSEQSSH